MTLPLIDLGNLELRSREWLGRAFRIMVGSLTSHLIGTILNPSNTNGWNDKVNEHLEDWKKEKKNIIFLKKNSNNFFPILT
jgi:hypothetical protein